MSRHRYGQGNGPGWAKRMRANRRTSELVRATDERDVGVRRGVERVFGLDGPEWSIDGMIVQPETAFRALAHRWLAKETA